ncbi:MAG: PA4642 family protein [Pseudohongiellaceae bacterium]
MKTKKKTGADRTQPSIRDEWWSDERIKSFLTLDTTVNEAPDFHILSKAYRGMVVEAFSRFIVFFIKEGRNINEKNYRGETILKIVSEHRNSTDYLEILKQAGAEP